MSLNQVVSNTWHCDRITCPDPDVVAEVNPYHRVEMTKPSIPQHEPLIIDLCPICIQVVASQSTLVQNWLAGLPPA